MIDAKPPASQHRRVQEDPPYIVDEPPRHRERRGREESFSRPGRVEQRLHLLLQPLVAGAGLS